MPEIHNRNTCPACDAAAVLPRHLYKVYSYYQQMDGRLDMLRHRLRYSDSYLQTQLAAIDAAIPGWREESV